MVLNLRREFCAGDGCQYDGVQLADCIDRGGHHCTCDEFGGCASSVGPGGFPGAFGHARVQELFLGDRCRRHHFGAVLADRYRCRHPRGDSRGLDHRGRRHRSLLPVLSHRG